MSAAKGDVEIVDRHLSHAIPQLEGMHIFCDLNLLEPFARIQTNAFQIKGLRLNITPEVQILRLFQMAISIRYMTDLQPPEAGIVFSHSPGVVIEGKQPHIIHWQSTPPHIRQGGFHPQGGIGIIPDGGTDHRFRTLPVRRIKDAAASDNRPAEHVAAPEKDRITRLKGQSIDPFQRPDRCRRCQAVVSIVSVFADVITGSGDGGKVGIPRLQTRLFHGIGFRLILCQNGRIRNKTPVHKTLRN